MENQTTAFTFAVNPEVSASVHDDGIVLIHIGNGYIYTSNTIGAYIWRGITEQWSLEAIADSITHEYQVEHNTAGEHVLRFLIQLQRQGIIERKGES